VTLALPEQLALRVPLAQPGHRVLQVRKVLKVRQAPKDPLGVQDKLCTSSTRRGKTWVY